MEPLVWIGIAACLAHSGIFSGLNLALMGLPRLRLEAEARGGNPDASTVLELRILLWTPEDRRVLTGADILGRLLRGIATREAAAR